MSHRLTPERSLETIFEKLIESVDVSILEGTRTFTQQLKNIGRKVSKTHNAAGLSNAVDAAPHPVVRLDRSVGRAGDGEFFDRTLGDLGHVERDEPSPDLKPATQKERRVETAFDVCVVARVSRLIRIVVAGLISLALAIGLLLCFLFWRNRR